MTVRFKGTELRPVLAEAVANQCRVILVKDQGVYFLAECGERRSDGRQDPAWASCRRSCGARHRDDAGVKAPADLHRRFLVNIGERAGTRTQDLQIKSPLLYQLSYALAPGAGGVPVGKRSGRVRTAGLA